MTLTFYCGYCNTSLANNHDALQHCAIMLYVTSDAAVGEGVGDSVCGGSGSEAVSAGDGQGVTVGVSAGDSVVSVGDGQGVSVSDGVVGAAGVL